jgi:hypothetical protein
LDGSLRGHHQQEWMKASMWVKKTKDIVEMLATTLQIVYHIAFFDMTQAIGMSF